MINMSDNTVTVTMADAYNLIQWLNDHIGRGSIFFRPNFRADDLGDLGFLWWADAGLTKSRQTFNICFKNVQDLSYFLLARPDVRN